MKNMPTNKQVSGEARAFLVGLMQEAGLDILPPENREKIFSELAVRLDAKLTLAALESLPDEVVGEFKSLLSRDKTPFQISGFLNKNIPNIGEIYAKAFADFRKVYLGR